jgi:hypothetical protein
MRRGLARACRGVAAATVLAAAGCGARSELLDAAAATSGPSTDAGALLAAGPCGEHGPSSPGPCAAWKAAGPAVRVSEPQGDGASIELAAVLARGCGVLIGWTSLGGSAPDAITLSFGTRLVGLDAAPLAPIEPHLALATRSNGSGWMGLAANGPGVAALTRGAPGGCRFVSLDANGADLAAPVPVADAACGAFARAGGGTSYLAPSSQGETPPNLARLDVHGAAAGRTTLAVPAGRALWDRLLFDDDSFLLYTFREDPQTQRYTGWLQHFDVVGAALAPEADVPDDGVPVRTAATSAGAIAAWETAVPGGLPLGVVSIDRDGRRTGPVGSLPASGAQYGLALAATPDGGALAAWLELHGPSDWRLVVQALAPDATARGEARPVLEGVQASRFQIVVGTPDRALLLYGDAGVNALPLVCAR